MMTKTLLAIVLMMIFLLGAVMKKVEVSKCFPYLFLYFLFLFFA